MSKHAVIIPRTVYRHERWKPRVEEVTRICNKTVFTKCGFASENRYLKKYFAMKFFESKDAAMQYCKSLWDKCGITASENVKSHYDELEKAAVAALRDEIYKWPEHD